MTYINNKFVVNILLKINIFSEYYVIDYNIF